MTMRRDPAARTRRCQFDHQGTTERLSGVVPVFYDGRPVVC